MTCSNPAGRITPIGPDPASVGHHANAVADAFAAAARARPVAGAEILVGSAVARIEVAGPSLFAQLIRPMRRAASGEIALTIRAWDEGETGVAWPLDRALASSGLFALHYADALLDGGPRLLHAAYRAAGLNPSWERAAPLRPMLDFWSRGHGDLFIHAGAVAIEGRAALLAGPSGAGKSSAALAAAGAGMDFLGDDYCLLAADGTVHGVYNSAKRHDGAAPDIPWLRRIDQDSPDDREGKRVFYLGGLESPRLGRPAPLAAILIIDRGGERAGMRRASAGGALRALLPSNLFQAPVIDRAAIARLATICRNTPCWRLTPSSDPDESARLVRQSLSRS